MSERLPTKKRVTKAPARKASARGLRASGVPELVAKILQGYADRGVFRGFHAGAPANGKAVYQMIWHYDRRFELLLDTAKKTLRFPALLPAVDAEMYAALRQFLAERQSGALPPHRSVDPARARLGAAIRGGTVSLGITSRDGDFEYAARRLILVAHEIFLGFLSDGPYFEYLVEHLGLDPDRY